MTMIFNVSILRLTKNSDIIISIVLAKPLNNAQISESFLYKDFKKWKRLDLINRQSAFKTKLNY